MLLKIIGSAAGGGFPQWNCNYALSRAARAGEPGFQPRTQSSLAVSADGTDWVLFNASPDIRQQIAATPQLQPPADGPLRATPIRAVVLTNADVDHIAGLLSLRERQPFAIYATDRVLQVLETNSIFNVLDRAIVPRRRLVLNERTEILGAEEKPTGITVEAFAVPGKVALFLEDEAQEGFGTEEGDTVGVQIEAVAECPSSPCRDLLPVKNGEKEEAATSAPPSPRLRGEGKGEGQILYIPGCARIDEPLKTRIAEASCLLFDGTVYHDDEMIRAGVGSKTGARMGHLHIAGEVGSMSQLADVPAARRIYVHINNSNPILDENSAEHAAVRAAGWEVAYDGMEIAL
ncbi:coenzyme PQQ synthesis protein B [Brucella endophytica]|uniref:Coenzyme PQQ synthesis protein B n=1 Tax=Brucella endophytica TaxID=1963359 RepID=A0A916WA74_9HYPH|nr:pyrroloquinoline quinone biosynthesis protein PqqB [Brucella endophytica]GGA81839.1 coenzyme PQQ synthesis protein B [Brucella endophytica]